MTIPDALQLAAGTLPFWYRPLVAVLALLVVGCVQFYAASVAE